MESTEFCPFFPTVRRNRVYVKTFQNSNVWQALLIKRVCVIYLVERGSKISDCFFKSVTVTILSPQYKQTKQVYNTPDINTL